MSFSSAPTASATPFVQFASPVQMSAVSGWSGSMRQASSKSRRMCGGEMRPRPLLPGSFQRFQKRMRRSRAYFVRNASHIPKKSSQSAGSSTAV